VLGYKVPVLKTSDNHEELFALEVLAGLLDGGASARLTKSLVRGQQIATSVGADYGMHALHDSLFSLSAIPATNVDMKQLELALKQEITKLQNTPPTKKEMDRVIAQVIASSVYEKDSSFYRAMEIGILETNGLGWRKKDEYFERVKAVTAEQVQHVAMKYFSDDRLTVAVLEPASIKSGSMSKAGVMHAN